MPPNDQANRRAASTRTNDEARAHPGKRRVALGIQLVNCVAASARNRHRWRRTRCRRLCWSGRKSLAQEEGKQACSFMWGNDDRNPSYAQMTKLKHCIVAVHHRTPGRINCGLACLRWLKCDRRLERLPKLRGTRDQFIEFRRR